VLAGLEWGSLVPGPKPFYVQFSLINYGSGPYGEGSLPVQGLRDQLAYSALQHIPQNSSAAKLSVAPQFRVRRLGAFRTNGQTTRGRPFWASLEAAGTDTEEVFALDLQHVLFYSSDLTKSASPFLTRSATAETETCPLEIVPLLPTCEARTALRDGFASDDSLLGQWTHDSSLSRLSQAALATDGGMVDASGLVSLVKAKVRAAAACVRRLSLTLHWSTTRHAVC
jgi:hypothetical protein